MSRIGSDGGARAPGEAASLEPPVAVRGIGPHAPPRTDRERHLPVALCAMTIVLILASRWISPNFGSWDQVIAILTLSSFVLVVAFGQQMVMLVGGLDLSVASVMTLGGILMFGWVGGSPEALLWGIPAVLAVTAAVGALNGLAIALVGIPPFVVTLASGIIVYSAALGVTQGAPRGTASEALATLYRSSILGLPPVVYLLVAMVALALVLQRRTVFGRRLYAIGTSREAAHIAGVPVRRTTIACYAISGGAAGAAGILMVGFSGGATLSMGQAYLVPSVAAAVIGGTSILGGRGDFLGAAGGAVLLTTFSTIVAALGVAEGWRMVTYGAVILAALLLLNTEFPGRRTAGRPSPR